MAVFSFLMLCVCACLLVSKSLCDAVAKLRRWCQKRDKSKIIFLDESNIRVNETPRTTLVAPGETPYVIVEDSSAYAARYDCIAAITSKEVLPCIIYGPEDRKELGVDVITTRMLIDYIDNILAQAVSALDRYPIYIILDRSNIHHKAKMLEAFHDKVCQDVVDILYMPVKSAKRLSPLDNAFFHEWKERVRQRSPLTKENMKSVMTTELYNITSNHLANYYKHCRLTHGQDVYSDCPNPSVHQHTS